MGVLCTKGGKNLQKGYATYEITTNEVEGHAPEVRRSLDELARGEPVG